MTKYVTCIGLLVISLFIYFFYRTELTVCNQLLIQIIGRETYIFYKLQIQTLFPLYNLIIYSLPEGFWILVTTLSSAPFYIQLKKKRFKLLFLPLLIGFSLELLQCANVVKGHFDVLDLLSIFTFWTIGYFFSSKQINSNFLLFPFTTQKAFCFFSYLVVYMAHVVA